MIIRNAIKTPDGTILESNSVHDFVYHNDANGELYFTDGGRNYIRRSVNGIPYERLDIFSDAPHEIIREYYTWGSYGKDGKGPLKRIKLKDMESTHICAILKTQYHISAEVIMIFEHELEYRENFNEFIQGD